MSELPIENELIDAYARDGVIVLRGMFRDWVETIAAGIERNMAEPGPFAAENLKDGDKGRFFDDYCNWERIPEFADVVRQSPAAWIAATIMRSRTAQFFHDHVLVKEPGTAKRTPWHQDIPYYFVSGEQNASMWISVDSVDEDTAPRFIAGSHRWEKLVLPVRWLDDSDFYAEPGEYLPVPDPDNEPGRYDVRFWAVEPGDAIIFHYRTVHGAPGNLSNRRRRAFSLRWVGDDARYVQRPGRTSPPFPGHDMKDGQRLREDWFPILWPQASQAA